MFAEYGAPVTQTVSPLRQNPSMQPIVEYSLGINNWSQNNILAIPKEQQLRMEVYFSWK